MSKKKVTALLLSLVLLSSITIGIIGYFFSKSIISKNKNQNELDINVSDDNIVDIHQKINKFDLAKNTLSLVEYINNGLIKFDKNIIENNLYSFISENIFDYYKNIDRNLINISIYYQINYNKLNIIAYWKIQYNVNNNEFYKEYNDKFTLKIDRKN